MRIRSFVVLMSFAVLALSLSAIAAVTDPVKVEQGLLAGTSGSTADVRVYRGVPFAAPAVGDLRWKAPQPAAKWQGVRQAVEFSHACWQTQYPAAAAIYQAKL
ncbi:MAG TPA: carboxylesterase family protein, partial [Candidatus Binatia bacterium]|nr:carboxylesterase family protein [Candidatus Binatia bacterium]